MTWWVFYGGLTLMTLALSLGAWRSLQIAGVVLAVLYLLTNLARQLGPLHMLAYPFIDAVALACFVLMWSYKHESWLVLLCVLFASDLVIHAFFFDVGDYRPVAVYRYDLSLNLIFIAQLATVSIPSAWILYDKRKP